MFLVSSCSGLCPIHWSQVSSREWRCSWSSADRPCSNYIWVINNFIASKGKVWRCSHLLIGRVETREAAWIMTLLINKCDCDFIVMAKIYGCVLFKDYHPNLEQVHIWLNFPFPLLPNDILRGNKKNHPALLGRLFSFWTYLFRQLLNSMTFKPYQSQCSLKASLNYNSTKTDAKHASKLRQCDFLEQMAAKIAFSQIKLEYAPKCITRVHLPTISHAFNICVKHGLHNYTWVSFLAVSLQWCHNGCDRVSIDYLTVCTGADQRNIEDLCVNYLCERNSPVDDEFPSHRPSNAENASIWWRHLGTCWSDSQRYIWC